MKTNSTRPRLLSVAGLVLSMSANLSTPALASGEVLTVSALDKNHPKTYVTAGTVREMRLEPCFQMVFQVKGEPEPKVFTWDADTAMVRDGRYATPVEFRNGDPARIVFIKEGARLTLTAITAGTMGENTGKMIASAAPMPSGTEFAVK